VKEVRGRRSERKKNRTDAGRQSKDGAAARRRRKHQEADSEKKKEERKATRPPSLLLQKSGSTIKKYNKKWVKSQNRNETLQKIKNLFLFCVSVKSHDKNFFCEKKRKMEYESLLKYFFRNFFACKKV